MIVYQNLYGNEVATEENCQIHLQPNETVDQYLWKNFFWPMISKGKKISAIYLGHEAFNKLHRRLYGYFYNTGDLNEVRGFAENRVLWGAKIISVNVSPMHIHAVLESLS